MEITINIDNEKLDKLINIKDQISSEEMTDLFKEGLQQYFKSEVFFNKFSNIMFTRPYQYADGYELSRYGQQLLNNFFNDSETKAEYVQIITNILEQHSKEILIKGLADIIIQGLLNDNNVVSAIRSISQTEIESYINKQINNEWIN